MPELPDVEALARRLRRTVGGRRIRNVKVLSPSTVRSPDPRLFTRRLRGRRITRIWRRGKYLLIDLDRPLTLVVHLRMTGNFALAPRASPLPPHTRVVLDVDGEELRFIDQRRFGHMDLLPTPALKTFEGLRRLGEEPLGRGFTRVKLEALLRGRRGALKGLLLRQDLIAGIGNLYADEILFRARVLPARTAESLRPAELRRLHETVRSVLREATTALSRNRAETGGLLDNRERGGVCPRCGRELSVARIAGRTTFFCRFCQT
jgi:formamidopyrimidine-DNA glycosylase